MALREGSCTLRASGDDEVIPLLRALCGDVAASLDDGSHGGDPAVQTDRQEQLSSTNNTDAYVRADDPTKRSGVVLELDLSGAPLSRTAVQILARFLATAKQAQDVETLSLAGAQIKDTGLAILLKALYDRQKETTASACCGNDVTGSKSCGDDDVSSITQDKDGTSLNPQTVPGSRLVTESIASISESTRLQLKTLNLRRNGLTKASASALAGMFVPSSDTEPNAFAFLRTLDLTNNNLGHVGCTIVSDAASQLSVYPSNKLTADESHSSPTVLIDGNLVLVEVLNGITHGFGSLVTVFASALMLLTARNILPMYQTISLLIFCTSLFTMFLSSCVYHSCFRVRHDIREMFHAADHCAIFLLIAGSYTPFLTCYTFDPPTRLGPATLVLAWILAIIGILMSLKVIYASRKTRALFALGMGWIGLMPVKLMLERMPRGAVHTVVAGGLSYSFGVIFYLAGKRRPMLHVIWHFAVMLGGGLHFHALSHYYVKPAIDAHHAAVV